MEPPYLWRRKNREDATTGKAPISIRIEIAGFPRAEMLTRIFSTEAEWSSAAGRKVEARGMAKEERQLLRQDNEDLAGLVRQLRQMYRALRSQGGDPSPAQVRDLVRGSSKSSTEQHVTAIMQRIVETKQRQGKQAGTLKMQRFGLGVVAKFIKEKKPGSLIQQVSRPWLRSFERWCMAHPYKRNTIVVLLGMVREAVNFALDEGWVKENPFFQYRLEAEDDSRSKRHLSEQEVTMLASVVFPKASWRRVLDSFLFCCYTGLSRADYRRFAACPENFISYEPGPDGQLVKGIKIVRQKLLYRQHERWIPLFPDAEALLVVYSYKLPIYKASHVNARLKIVAAQFSLSVSDLSHKDARSTFAQLMRDRYGKKVAATLGMHSEEVAQKHYSSESAQGLLRELSILGVNLTHN